MLHRRIPEWVRHAPSPRIRAFGVLAACDALARSVLLSVFPVLLYRVLQDAEAVSRVYLVVGVVALIVGLLTPMLARLISRRWTFTFGAVLYAVSAGLVLFEGERLVITALMLHTISTVIVFVSLSAYVLDFVARVELGKCETTRLFYSALSWSVGPFAGVMLLQWSPAAPFAVSFAAALVLLAVFWRMHLGNGRVIRRGGIVTPNPLRYLPRFLAQPRLVAGWLFAVMRSCGWWVYIVYLPIFAVEQGLGESVGGAALSISNGMLFLSPLMLRWMQKHSVRRAVRTGFLFAALSFAGAALAAYQPWAAVAFLMTGSAFLVLLDISAGLPFLMAVKPSERVEMSAVYSIYRDVSSIMTPGAAWLVLLAAPLPGIFAAGAAGLFGAWIIARALHPRLGAARLRRPAV
ncbi:MAG: MFS transporter [Rhodospirillales bacterium]